MPSFAYEVRSELSNISNYRLCCDTAQLNGMLKVGATLEGNRIDFKNTNASVARKLLKLVKKVYPEAKTEVAFIRNKRFRITNQYVVRIFQDSNTTPLFKSMKVNKFPDEDCCKNAYLRGLFLACGTLNRPESYYHLEIFTTAETTAKFIEKHMKRMGFRAHLFERKDKYVVYLKEFDVICDFLYIINAKNAVERFEVAQNIKEVKANVNRIVNCETANMQRAINAAQKQIRDIRMIDVMGKKLDDKLREVADARLKYPELTISEVAEKIFISASCFKHRMFQIHLIANPKEKYNYNKKMKRRNEKLQKQKEEAQKQKQ